MRLVGRAFHHLPDITRSDEITQHEGRFRQLKQLLPPHTVVGYVTDLTPQGAAHDDQFQRLAFKRYLLTQYALVPAIVLPGVHGSFVVGNFYSSSGIDRQASKSLMLIRDFGDGVTLYRTSSE
jgi:hypothetical protein